MNMFEGEDSSSEKKLVLQGEFKKHLLICFAEYPRLRGSHIYSLHRVSVDDKLIKFTAPSEPPPSQGEVEAEICRVQCSWRSDPIPPDKFEQLKEFVWRGLGYSVLLADKLLQHPIWPRDELQYISMACINVKETLYFFGGYVEEETPSPPFSFSKQVHSYDLLKARGHFRCADILESGFGCRSELDWKAPPLVAHVDGKIYVLCYVKKTPGAAQEAASRAFQEAEDANRKFEEAVITCSSWSEKAEDALHEYDEADCLWRELADAVSRASRYHTYFQEYDIARNKWSLLSLFDGAENFDFPPDLNLSPHSVIGNKLCASLGNSSFAFDTVMCVWEDCMLFGSRHSNKIRGCMKNPSLLPAPFLLVLLHLNYLLEEGSSGVGIYCLELASIPSFPWLPFCWLTGRLSIGSDSTLTYLQKLFVLVVFP